MLLTLNLCAQQDTIRGIDDVKSPLLKNDTLIVTGEGDSLSVVNADTVQKMKVSANAIDKRIDYKALDSIRFDMKNKKIFLFKNDELSYDNINVKADYVEIDFNEETVFASGAPDSVGKIIGKPVFKIDEDEFESEEMRYNYVSKKGMIYNVKMNEDESYIHGSKVKKLEDNTSNIYQGRFTTCDLDHPHFFLFVLKS